MTFLQRLKWFTRARLQNYIDLANKVHREEWEETELRLAQTGRFEEGGKPAIKQVGDLPAVFMPPPGHIPSPKKDIKSEIGVNTSSPWGGKFSASPVTRTQSFGVINLFELAMTQSSSARSRLLERRKNKNIEKDEK